MSPSTRPADGRSTKDPGLEKPPSGEWLYKSSGRVYGPIPAAELVEMLGRGSVGGATPISGPDGQWRPLDSTPGFLLPLRKAEAKARVEAEVALVRRRERLRRTSRVAAMTLAVFALFALVGGGAWLLAARRSPGPRREARADFGDGIAIGTVQIGVGSSAGREEIAVPAESTGPGARPRRGGPSSGPTSVPAATAPAAPGRVSRAGPAARPSGTAEGGDLIIAQYDARRIRETVAREQASLAPCVQEEARRSPELSGEIPIEFAVGNDGKVTALWIQDARYRSGELHDCLLRRLRTWSFDPFPGQRPVVSLAFRVGAP